MDSLIEGVYEQKRAREIKGITPRYVLISGDLAHYLDISDLFCGLEVIVVEDFVIDPPNVFGKFIQVNYMVI